MQDFSESFDALDSSPSPESTFTVEDFQNQLAFPLDDFQRDAAKAITNGHSVVVCAPTGSGKTIVAEFAAMRALAQGKKLFYTTPLKALSNQKFSDLRSTYGDANVGLLTGDVSVNRDARIVVMTTEIFRNLLYGGRDDNGLLNSLGAVVLDECHYMNDANRGTVWEESIIYCPKNVQIVALSATVANADELTAWINEIHHDTQLISTDFRPVPLRFSYYNREALLPLFEAPGRLNKQLKNDRKDARLSKKNKIFHATDLISIMHQKDMLPAIFFTFSRKDCDMGLEQTQRLNLLTPQERQLINRKVNDYITQNDFLADNRQIHLIRNGFASHHAGLLPGIKHLVESLFQQGLIKVVFATETLAAGINMPARSTVITKISKRTDDGHRLLTASEFLQMSGRAGRRGMDPVGYVIVVSSPYEGAQEAAVLASSAADPLNSRFTPNYGMVLNLLRRHSLEQAEYLVRQSFAQFTAARRLKPLEDMQELQEREVATLQSFTCPYGVSDKDFHSFLRSREMMSETGRFIKILQRQLTRHGKNSEIADQLAHEQGKMANLKEFTQTLPCGPCELLKKHKQLDGHLMHHQDRLKSVRKQLDKEKDTYWRRFMNIHSLLKNTGYLDEQDRPSKKGAVTVQIRAENEYAMTEVLMDNDILEGLTGPQMAAIMCALINDSTRDNQFVKLPLSAEVTTSGRQIEGLYRRVDRLQRKHGVDVTMPLNAIASPLAEAWAHGMPWDRLINTTNIGEGDIVRLFRRTADILRQVSRTEGINSKISDTAREALRLINRVPIKEMELVEENELDAEDGGSTVEKGMPEFAQPEGNGSSRGSVKGVESERSNVTSEEKTAPPSENTGTASEAITLPEQTTPLQTDASTAPPAQPLNPAHRDWKPLGTVRDYFNEQMRQDWER